MIETNSRQLRPEKCNTPGVDSLSMINDPWLKWYLCNIRRIWFINEQIISDFKNVFLVIAVVFITVLYLNSPDITRIRLRSIAPCNMDHVGFMAMRTLPLNLETIPAT